MKGFKITNFADGSAARSCGLKVDDVIIKFGEQDAASVDKISEQVEKPIDGMDITFARKDAIETINVKGDAFGFVAIKIDIDIEESDGQLKVIDKSPKKPDLPSIEKLLIAPKYGMGRMLANMTVFLGWLCIIGGFVLLMADTDSIPLAVRGTSSLFLIMFGWLGILQSQVILATMDTADSQREATNILYTMLLEQKEDQARNS